MTAMARTADAARLAYRFMGVLSVRD